MSEKSVLFVCLGNICRSPLAEVIFQNHLRQRNLQDSFRLDSAGTGAWHIGKPAHHQSIRVASDNGIDLSQHRARQVCKDDFDHYDYIVAMDTSNYYDLKSLQLKGKAEIVRIRDYDSDQSDPDVPDPYYGGPEGFDAVFRILDRCCCNFLDSISSRS